MLQRQATSFRAADDAGWAATGRRNATSATPRFRSYIRVKRAAHSWHGQKCSTCRCCFRARTNGGAADSPGFVRRSVSTRNNFPSRSRRKGFEHCTFAHRLSIISPDSCKGQNNTHSGVILITCNLLARLSWTHLGTRFQELSFENGFVCRSFGNRCRRFVDTIAANRSRR
jgi:hypothetical protein